MRKICALALVLIFAFNSFLLFSCVPTPECTEHIDSDDDTLCDNCGEYVELAIEPDCTEHIDSDGDTLCDNCGKYVEPGSTPEPPSGIDDPEKYSDFTLSEDKLASAVDVAISKADQLIETVGLGFPSVYSNDNVYSASDKNQSGWVQGFWPGILWNVSHISGSSKYSNIALSHVQSFYDRIVNKLGVDNHDLGFLYTPSCVSAYKELGNVLAKEAALLAADQLMTRYHEDVGFIQAWGTMGDEAEYRLIIDCLMNLPLLYFASEEIGDSKYRDAAYAHYKNTVEVIFREDGGSYHTYYFDKETGEPAYGKTKQGYADESTWSRGQAWGMYGSLLTYKYTGDESCLDTFKMAANYFLNHLPEDYVAYWDFTFGDGSGQPRDTSAAAIAVCALLECEKYLDESDPNLKVYRNAAHRIMNSLIDNYSTKDSPDANGQLLHGTANGNRTDGKGISEMTIFGDYFYTEALRRFLDPDMELYW